MFNNCCNTNQIPVSSPALISVWVFPPTAIWIIIITLLTLRMQHTHSVLRAFWWENSEGSAPLAMCRSYILNQTHVSFICASPFSAHLQATGWPLQLSVVLNGDPLLCLSQKKNVSLLLKINYWHSLPPAIKIALALLWLTTTNSIYINIILSLFNPRILKFINYSCRDQQHQFG